MKLNMSGLFTKRRIKGLGYLTVAVITAAGTYYTNGFIEQILSSVSIICDLQALNYIFTDEGTGRKIGKKIEKIMLRITKALLNFAKRIIEKFSFSNGRSFKGARMAKEYSDIKERTEGGIPGRRKKKKYKRYKYMSNVEKVRFLYDKKVTGAIKKGVPLEEYMTPNEAGRIMMDEKYMKRSENVLIGTYNAARYDDEAVITDEMVDEI